MPEPSSILARLRRLLAALADRGAPAAPSTARPGTLPVVPDFRLTFDTLEVPLYLTDAEGYLVYYNEAAARFWGARPPLGVARWAGSWRLFTRDGTPIPPEENAVARALRSGRPVRCDEVVAERPDGTRVPFVTYPTPLYGTDGTLLGAVNVLIDVTSQAHVAMQARAAEQAKTRFLAAMSHEFRTPLHVLLGFADLLADTIRRGQPLTAEHLDWIEEMQAAGRHLLGLVTDAVAFAEASLGGAGSAVKRRPARLGAIVSDAITTSAPAFAARGASCVPEGPPDDATAALDPSAARQALLSVLREVVRHLPAGGRVHVGWGVAAEDQTARIELRCPRLDLPPELLRDLDTPFAGSDRDTRHRGLEGAGLSVATAAALLRGHGGRLEIAGGQDGAPVVFRLLFPMAPAGVATEAGREQPPPDPLHLLRALPPASLADVVDAANDLVVITAADLDPPGPTIVYVNRTFTRVTGYVPDEVLGRTPRMLQGPDTDRGALRRLYEELRGGGEAKATLVNYTRSGRPYWVDMRIVPLRDADGGVRHFAAIERLVDAEWSGG